MTESSKAADNKRKLLKCCFLEQRLAWGNMNDDRGVFCNMYDLLMESLTVMESIDNNFIWVAYNKEFKEEMGTMEKLKIVLKEDNFITIILPVAVNWRRVA